MHSQSFHLQGTCGLHALGEAHHVTQSSEPANIGGQSFWLPFGAESKVVVGEGNLKVLWLCSCSYSGCVLLRDLVIQPTYIDIKLASVNLFECRSLTITSLHHLLDFGTNLSRLNCEGLIQLTLYSLDKLLECCPRLVQLDLPSPHKRSDITAVAVSRARQVVLANAARTR